MAIEMMLATPILEHVMRRMPALSLVAPHAVTSHAFTAHPGGVRAVAAGAG
jgi:hypothetical protein